MMRLEGLGGVAAAALLILAAAGTGRAQEKETVPFDELRQGWIADLEGHKLEASLARYAPDASFINPDGTHATTPKQMKLLFGFVFGAIDAKIAMTPRTTSEAGAGPGSMAFESGAYSEDLTERGTTTMHHLTGDYLTIYKKQADGKWLIVQHMWTLTRSLQ